MYLNYKMNIMDMNGKYDLRMSLILAYTFHILFKWKFEMSVSVLWVFLWVCWVVW